jgi:hypothetical protein
MTPLMNRRYSTRYPGATLRFHKYAQKGIHAEFALGRLGNNSRKTASHGNTVAHGVTRAGLRVLRNAGIVPCSHSHRVGPRQRYTRATLDSLIHFPVSKRYPPIPKLTVVPTYEPRNAAAVSLRILSAPPTKLLFPM